MLGYSNTIKFLISTMLFFIPEVLFLLLLFEISPVLDGLLPFLLLYLLIGLASQLGLALAIVEFFSFHIQSSQCLSEAIIGILIILLGLLHLFETFDLILLHFDVR